MYVDQFLPCISLNLRNRVEGEEDRMGSASK